MYVNGKKLTPTQEKKFVFFMEKSPEFKEKFEKLMNEKDKK